VANSLGLRSRRSLLLIREKSYIKICTLAFKKSVSEAEASMVSPKARSEAESRLAVFRSKENDKCLFVKQSANLF
jgi:hypothetical protein